MSTETIKVIVELIWAITFLAAKTIVLAAAIKVLFYL
jgi:hypothetical protein